VTDRWRGVSASEAETETSPGVLLSSGYIAGGTLCGLLLGFVFMPLGSTALTLMPKEYLQTNAAKVLALVMFAILGAIMLWVGSRKTPVENNTAAAPPPENSE
jgi:hypothetical protein